MRALQHFVRQAVYDSLIAEVSATPKPGLVDLHDSGAHRDMDHRTFTASAGAITPHLGEMFETGLNWPDPADEAGLFAQIRRIGIAAEQAMFSATAGVNTHKGMIFSMGTIAAAAGYDYRRNRRFAAEPILLLAGRLCADAMREDFAAMERRKPKTHGEILYVRHGYRGIRGEAADGFPSIRTISFPYLNAAMEGCHDPNPAYINTLFHLMAHMDDTNVLIRTNSDTLRYMQEQSRAFLREGGAFHPAAMDRLADMNRDFTKRNISPGGCADLLAVTIFLRKLEQYEKTPASV